MLHLFFTFSFLAVAASTERLPLIQHIKKRNGLFHTSKLAAFMAASPDTVTTNFASLQRREHPINCESHPSAAVTKLTEFGGVEYLTQVQINNQTLTLVVDSGSSDTWTIGNSFKCYDSLGRQVAPQTCGFSPGYQGDFGSNVIPNVLLNIVYGDQSFARGSFGLANVTLAGITVVDQQVALANQARWIGSGEDSGIIGLAYSGIVAAFLNGDRTKRVPYSPIFTTMYDRQLVKPVFSLALKHGGDSYLAFGGVPPVQTKGSIASTPILMSTISNELTLAYYTIIPDSLVYPGSPGNDSGMYIVDSGTTLTYLPDAVARHINSLFQPPATVSPRGLYMVDCNAIAPDFGVTIDGKVFKMSPRGIITRSDPDCVSGIQSMAAAGSLGQGPVGILGDSFMDGLVSIFDVGAAEMRFVELA